MQSNYHQTSPLPAVFLVRHLLIALAATVPWIGCDRFKTTSTQGSQTELEATPGTSPPGGAEKQLLNTSLPATSQAPGTSPPQASMITKSDPYAVLDETGSQKSGPPNAPVQSEASKDQPRLELRGDLPPDRLVDFLGAADQDMQLIFTGRSGIRDPKLIGDELRRIITLKLAASRQLYSHTQATAEEQSIGKRGELQSLSHLASTGDLKASNELQTAATAAMNTSDTQLIADARLVLLGFAIEQVQNGDEQGVQEIVKLCQAYAASRIKEDVPAMMVMGQAREVLSKYGYDKEALQVRETILKEFAASKDPDVAMMAAKLAGAVQFDVIETLRTAAISGRAVAVSDWTQATETLIQESRDILTVQYLATAAIELEGAELAELAAATYRVLEASFGDGQDAFSREAQTAILAHQARTKKMGQDFDPQLPGLEGEQINLQEYRGRIILVPFWATSFPGSLQLMPLITEQQQLHPDQIAIIGMNLDQQTGAAATGARRQLGFPSFQSVTDPESNPPNPIAFEFGMTSLPFLVVIDPQGKVSDICFTEKQVNKSIERLLTNVSRRVSEESR